jgi:hypothetical protein
MRTAEIKRKLAHALHELLESEQALLSVDPNERSITHWLAIYVAAQFPGWDVDCEYNRNGRVPKRLEHLVRVRVTATDEEGITVYPDIVVHKRQKRENLLVIEVKKSTSRRSAEFDHSKLRGYLEEYDYRCAAHVVIAIPPKAIGASKITWF